MKLQQVLELVDGFHITDKKLLRARKAVGDRADAATIAAFRTEATRYFTSLAREAQQHIQAVDRRLDDLYQQQYNLQAERAVAERRCDSAHELLRALAQ